MIALLGGTFDPVHKGHLHAALSVCESFRLDRIHLLLSARPGHRAAPGASVEHRWRMLQIACAEDVRLVADDREIRRAARGSRPSWTVDTLEEIRDETGPGTPLLWVLGSDAFAGLTTWHRWESLLELAHLVVLRRPGVPLLLSPVLERLLEERQSDAAPVAPSGSIIVFDLPMQPVSATAVRAALGVGRAVDDLLPPAVTSYIRQHHLYGVVRDP